MSDNFTSATDLIEGNASHAMPVSELYPHWWQLCKLNSPFFADEYYQFKRWLKREIPAIDDAWLVDPDGIVAPRDTLGFHECAEALAARLDNKRQTPAEWDAMKPRLWMSPQLVNRPAIALALQAGMMADKGWQLLAGQGKTRLKDFDAHAVVLMTEALKTHHGQSGSWARKQMQKHVGELAKVKERTLADYYTKRPKDKHHRDVMRQIVAQIIDSDGRKLLAATTT